MRPASTLIFLLANLLSACGAAVPSPTDVAVAASPEHDAARLYSLGERAAANGDSVRAEQYLSLAIQRRYRVERALPLLLSVCVSSSRLRAALNHAEPYLRSHPEDVSLRYLVATIRVGLGEEQTARLELERILQEAPDNPDAHYLLGVLDEPMSAEDARRHFRTYLAATPTGKRAADVRGRLAELAVREDATRDLNASNSPDEPATEREAQLKTGRANRRWVDIPDVGHGRRISTIKKERTAR